jgi:hypothetical protein
MSDVNAGSVKAKVLIEYDGSGVEKAKEDLASLAAAGGSIGGNLEGANEGLAQLEEHAGRSAESARDFSSSLGELGRPLDGMVTSISEVNSVLGEGQRAIEGTSASFEAFQEPLGTTVSMLQESAAPMQAIAEHAQSVQTQVSAAGESFSQVGESLAQSVPLLPQFADSLHEINAAFEPQQRSVQAFTENLSNVQGVLENSQPFTVIQSSLAETSQAWGDATSSMHESNTSFLGEMNANVEVSEKAFANVAKQMPAFQTAFAQPVSTIQSFNTAMADANKNINEFGGVGTEMYGPMPKMAESIGFGEAFANAGKGLMGVLNDVAMPLMAVQMIGMAVQATGQAIYDSAVLVEGKAAHSYGSFTGTVDALGQSVQNLGGQFSESFGQAITPTLNVLNAQFADQGGIAKFLGDSAGGALGILFNIGQIASGINPMGGIAGLEGAFGLTSVEGPGPMSANPLQKQIDQFYQQANDPQYLAAQAYYGSAMAKAQKSQASWDTSHYAGTTGPLDPMNEILQAQAVRANGGVYGHVPEDPNLAWLDDLGNPGPGGYAEFYNGRSNGSSGNSSSFQATPGGGAAYMNNEEDTQTTSGAANIATAYSNIVAPKVLNDQQMKGMQDFFGGIGSGIGGFFGGIGSGIGNLFNGLMFNLNDSESLPSLTGGCFPAGTLVLMADGSSRAIETLQIGERVIARDDSKQIQATITDHITFAAKRIYRLEFSDGYVLFPTDSHPIATVRGWKSISPESTKLENPDLPVTPLEIGDSIYTADGSTCRLVSMQEHEIVPVFNITVDAVHTYYANNLLVHNGKTSNAVGPQIGQQASEQIGGIQLPHMDLTGMSSQLAGSFSGIQLPHMDLSGLSAGLGGAFSGISLPHIDMSGISGSLAGAFSGISMPPIPAIGSEISGALGGMFSGISMPAIPDIGGEISGALGGMFGGISMPSIPNIGGMVSGALSGVFGGISVPTPPEVGGMISGAMSGLFGGVEVPSPPEVGAMINGAMGGIFSGIQIPAPPNLGAQISGAMSSMFSGISLPSIPFFADGVSNFSGGAAVVGEAGAEVAEYGGQYALFDSGAAFVNLPAGSSVYPLQDLPSYSSPHMLGQGTGSGSMIPLSLGGGGSAPQSVNVIVQIDSQSILSAIGMPFAQNIRVASGMRGF